MVGISEYDTLFGQAVDTWCPQVLVTTRTKFVITHIVNDDHYDVRLPILCGDGKRQRENDESGDEVRFADDHRNGPQLLDSALSGSSGYAAMA